MQQQQTFNESTVRAMALFMQAVVEETLSRHRPAAPPQAQPYELGEGEDLQQPLTIKQAAEWSGLSQTHLRVMIKREELEALYFGGAIRIRKIDLIKAGQRARPAPRDKFEAQIAEMRPVRSKKAV